MDNNFFTWFSLEYYVKTYCVLIFFFYDPLDADKMADGIMAMWGVDYRGLLLI